MLVAEQSIPDKEAIYCSVTVNYDLISCSKHRPVTVSAIIQADGEGTVPLHS